MTVRKKGTQRRGERGTIAVRGYGLTSWSRAFVDVVEGRGADGESVADSRRITKARRYFRDRHLRGLRIGAGRVTASVEGPQLEPFDVILTTRTVDALRAADAGDIAVVVGGTIPQSDVQKLLDAGAAAVFPTGTSLEDLVRDVRALTDKVEQG